MTDKLLRTAEEAARSAGSILLECFRSRSSLWMREKDEGDLVTEADYEAEAAVIRTVKHYFPDHRLVCEENGQLDGSGDYTWYLDALDGTKNFSRGNPAWCVSVAVERAGCARAAVVYDPTRDELFSAVPGAGATLNKEPVEVSSTTSLRQALIATGFPSGRRHRNLDPSIFAKVAMASMGFRRSGSSALDLAYVACGRLDAMWDVGLSPWDIRAGLLLVQEAGGVVTDLNGEPWSAHSSNLLASNATLSRALPPLFSEWLQAGSNVAMTG